MVIIGLLVGGIVVGQQMIRNAELKDLTKEIDQIRVALHTFRMKYNALPGDMNNASSYWPSCTDSGTNPCNGNYDQKIDYGYERVRAWQHLSLAGLVPYQLTGLWHTNGLEEAGYNVPATPLGQDTGFGVFYLDRDPAGTDPLWFTMKGNFITTGRLSPSTANQYPCFGFLFPIEAYEIDKKFDDGMPAKGDWRTIGRLYNRNNSSLTPNNAWSCTDSDDDATAQYVYTLDVDSCSLNVKLD